MRILKAFIIVLLCTTVTWAQNNIPQMSLSDKLAELDLDSCRIKDIGIVVSDIEYYIKTDSLTQKTDTTLIVNPTEILWQSEGYNINNLEETARMRVARRGRRKVLTSVPTFQYGVLQDMFQEFYYYVFSFEYQSVDADGNPVTLSAMAACPTLNASEVNNVVIGTHITMTSDKERPSSHFNNFDTDDWGMLFSLAAGPKMLFTEKYSLIVGGASVSYIPGILASATLAFIAPGLAPLVLAGSVMVSIASFVYLCDQVDKANAYHAYNNNLVIMPDYEGYGASKDRAHPYLYQELTARQCVDAALYGMKLYKSDSKTQYIRLPFRDEFRTMSCGYSQGGSVALAVHRFIEQNNLDQTLHFSGSYCGDGPYDPMSTLMYYVEQEKKGELMAMPIVLPLIVKGMLDSNPYMVSHKVEEYCNPKFLETGIMDWLASKEVPTYEVWNKFKTLYEEGMDGDTLYFRDIFVGRKNSDGKIEYSCKLSSIMNAECYAYFSKLYDDNKDTYTSADGIPLPKKRGVMEDLHLALASNDITKGWNPRHTAYLFHSKGDTTVPYVNALKAQNTMGFRAHVITAPNGLDHGDSGKDFFRGDSDIWDIVFERTLNLRLYDFVTDITDKSY